jgi:hypothetical protein
VFEETLAHMKTGPLTEFKADSSSAAGFNWESTETAFKDFSPVQRLQWLETCIHEFLALRRSVGLPFPVRERETSY